MGTWIDQANAVVADTVYCDNELTAKDVSITLPEVTFLTADATAMGNMETPLVGLVDKMEATISKIGVDKGLTKMLTPSKHNFEFRYVQNTVAADGTTSPEGCKAFITGVPKGVPGIGVEVGSASNNDVTIAVTRYQLYKNGEEVICIDRLNSICRINGKDYYSEIASFL